MHMHVLIMVRILDLTISLSYTRRSVSENSHSIPFQHCMFDHSAKEHKEHRDQYWHFPRYTDIRLQLQTFWMSKQLVCLFVSLLSHLWPIQISPTLALLNICRSCQTTCVQSHLAGLQDLTRRLTWGASSAKLNETATLRPNISQTA